MSTKEAKNDVAIEKIADNDVADAKADLKGTKRTADVSVARVSNAMSRFCFELSTCLYFARRIRRDTAPLLVSRFVF